MSVLRGIVLAAMIVLLTGCEAQVVKVPPRTGVPVKSVASPAAAQSHQAAPAASFDPATINVKVGDEKDLAALIAKHKGKVVFVDYWATWCHPCVDFFPHTVDTFEKYQPQGLTAIAVSFDAPDKELEVRRFLASQRVRFENLICAYDPGAEAFEKFQLDLVPHFRLYDRQGRLRAKWDAEPTNLDAKVKELLAEK